MIQASIAAAGVPSARIAARSITAPPSPSGRERRLTAARTAPSEWRVSGGLLAGICPPGRAAAGAARRYGWRGRLRGVAGDSATTPSLLHHQTRSKHMETAGWPLDSVGRQVKETRERDPRAR